MVIDDVAARLASFGYYIPLGSWPLEFIGEVTVLINKVENRIISQCNTTIVPEELHQVEVDMVVGEFLFEKKSMGLLSLANIDLKAAVKSIQEGDTNITFVTGGGSLTPEQRLDALISSLMNPSPANFSPYRRIKW